MSILKSIGKVLEKQGYAFGASRLKLRSKPSARMIGAAVDKVTPIGELKIYFNRSMSRVEYLAFRYKLQKAFTGHIQLDISFDENCAKLLIDNMPVGMALYALSKVEGVTPLKIKKLKPTGAAGLLVCRYQFE
jgi:hypothetical protein